MDAPVAQRARKSGSSSQSPLRIGLLTDRRDGFANWQLALIDRIVADDRFRLETVIVCPTKQGETSQFFRLASAIERATLGRQAKYDLQETEVADLPFIILQEWLSGPGRESLDLILSISPLASGLESFSSLPFGSWHLSFLDAATSDADWYGYREVMTEKSSTEVRLTVRRDDCHEEQTVAIAEFNTKFSAIRNADFIKERTVTLVMRELRRIAEMRDLRILKTSPQLQTEPPRLGEWLAYAGCVVGTLMKRGYQAVKGRLGSGHRLGRSL